MFIAYVSTWVGAVDEEQTCVTQKRKLDSCCQYKNSIGGQSHKSFVSVL